MKLETILIHAGAEIDPATGAIAPPIHLSTTYEHTPDGRALRDHHYIREGHPTQSRLETALAEVEGGKTARVFASGMAAIAAYLQSVPEGAHVLCHTDVYTHTRVIGREFLSRWGCQASYVDMTDLDRLRAAIRPETRVLWFETPSNPGMDIIDIAAVAEIGHAAGAVVVADGTFATPVVQRPLALGADAVMHSMTKYLGGHSDVQGGAVVFARDDDRVARISDIRTVIGGVLSPFNAWLVLRGLRTLACRVERHSANALAIAEALAGHPGIERVNYPGLASHPGHDIARRQMRGFGGMMSIVIDGGRDEALEVASRVKLFRNATSLGGVESLLEHRQSTEGPQSLTPPNLLRVSVGLEAAEDLIADLKQALAGAVT